MDFTGQIAIVMGGSRGIGRDVARMLAERGANVMIGYRVRTDAADETIRLCQGLVGHVVAQPADIRSRTDVDALIEATLQRWERIDILVNCAGTTAYGPLAELSTERWRAILSTNLDGVYHTCKAVLRPMMHRRYGRIVNVAALHGLAGGPNQADYSAATGGVLGLTRALAREVAAWGITVNSIAPGLIATEMLDIIPQEQRTWGEQVIAQRRIGRPEEVAAAAIFLASSLASYITGIMLPVDGGWHMA